MLNFQSRVLLPRRLWREAANKEQLDKLILDYMQRYPNYVVLRIENHFAICDRKDIETRR